MPDTPALTIDLWSDLVCPWCWIGKHRIERALDAAGLEAQWRFHAYELGPREQKRQPTLQHLAEKYGVSLAEGRQMIRRVQDLGTELGLDINPDKQQTAPTYDAHRLVQAAQAKGDARALVERLHRAHFSEGLDLGDRAVLKTLAKETGMDAAEAGRVLEGGAYAAEVEEDERRAVSYEIGGVPFTVVNGRLAVGGAQSVKAFGEVLHKALAADA
ncbi:MAG TPA: DsbA family oxidoreductase [bacterium]|jgi:predicted DsbA family dithiol-disulfide isomerase|nr:DsbA family oxidoreductase [bacterium]